RNIGFAAILEFGKTLAALSRFDAASQPRERFPRDFVVEFADIGKPYRAIPVLGFQKLAVGVGDDVAIVIDDQGFTGLSDPQLRQKFGYAADFNIDTDDTANALVRAPDRRGQGDTGLLRGEEDIWIGPDRGQSHFRPLIPVAVPG